MEPDRDRLLKRGLTLEWITVGWNVLESVITVTAGVMANSFALVAFGLDSLVEIFASLVTIWHMRHDREGGGELRTRKAVRLIGVAFFLLGVYLIVDATRGVLADDRPETSVFGIFYMAAVVVAMVLLGASKLRTGKRASNTPLVANAHMTFLDAGLAGGVLVALGLNVVFGIWWADPLVAGVVGVIAIREGIESWRGELESGEGQDDIAAPANADTDTDGDAGMHRGE